MRELWKDRKFWLIFTAEIVLVVLAVYFAFWPLSKSIIGKANKMQEMKIDRELLTSRLSKIGEARAEHGKLSTDIRKLDVLLGKEEEVEFFKELEAIAGNTGNAINIKIIEDEKKDGAKTASVGVIDKEKKEVLDKLPYKNFFVMQINLRGGYAGLVNFLHKLENAGHYLTVISVNAQKVKETSSGEIAPAVSAPNSQQTPVEKEILNSLITVAVYRK